MEKRRKANGVRFLGHAIKQWNIYMPTLSLYAAIKFCDQLIVELIVLWLSYTRHTAFRLGTIITVVMLLDIRQLLVN